MGSPNFRFKQFTVWHDRCAMKVGTDGVLLGAWCPIAVDSLQLIVNSRKHKEFRVLDIGTGSGLIALMLAQRTCAVDSLQWTVGIDAIDVDEGAVEQATYNFEQSPWVEQLHAYQSSLQEWHSAIKYDLIVSNPPYFQASLKNPDSQRATARHTDTLSYAALIQHASRLLQEDGTLALVLPFEAKEDIVALAEAHALYPTQITYVHSKPGKPAKRLLIAFKRISSVKHWISNNAHPIPNTFYIESADSPRSDEYKALTQDFYL
ncbi:MAG: methyltransferase [Paludibacteraceae bacterium]|nr:methyltransferase [Paludibacteraceae bacterium]